MNCVYGLNFFGGFMSSGYLDVGGAASSGWAFAYQRILHVLRLLNRPEAVEVGEGAFFEAPRWQGLRLCGFLFGVVGRHGCTCTVQKTARSFARVSC